MLQEHLSVWEGAEMTREEKIEALAKWMKWRKVPSEADMTILADYVRYAIKGRQCIVRHTDGGIRVWRPFESLDDAWMLMERMHDVGCKNMGLLEMFYDQLEDLSLWTAAEAATAICETAAGRREQAAILRDLAGLDFGELDARRAAIFDDRTLANRRLNDAKARLDAAPSHKNAPGAEVSVADLADELEAARVANQEYKTIGQRLIDQDVEIRQMQSEIERLQSELETAKEFRATDKAEFEALSQIDEEPIRERMRTAEAMNQQVRENATRIELHGEVGVWRDKAEVLTEQLVKIDTEKTATLAAAKMPIEGLGVDDSGVTYKGVPFEQASSAEALRVSVAMGLAGNSELRVMLVHDGSLLDSRSLKLLGELAAEADSQIWVERVSEGAECTVIIEDGRVAEEEEL